MATALIDLPDEERMALRGLIEQCGGEVDGYDRECFLVAIPRPSSTFFKAMDATGRFAAEPDSLWYYPLGSDKPPEHFRHDGNYKGSRGFWLYGKYRKQEKGD